MKNHRFNYFTATKEKINNILKWVIHKWWQPIASKPALGKMMAMTARLPGEWHEAPKQETDEPRARWPEARREIDATSPFSPSPTPSSASLSSLASHPLRLASSIIHCLMFHSSLSVFVLWQRQRTYCTCTKGKHLASHTATLVRHGVILHAVETNRLSV